MEFSLKVIFRIWMFRVDGMHLILYGYWWKLSQFIMVLFLELLSLCHEIYQFFFLFFKDFLIWRNLVLEFALKVICRIWMLRDEINELILNSSRWKPSQFIMVFVLEFYQLFVLFFKTLIIRKNFSSEFPLKVIFRRFIFSGDIKNLILNVSWWEIVWFFF